MLVNRDFTLFFVGSLLSAIGTAMVPVALSFAVLDTGHSANALGLVLAAQTVPIVLLLLFGGVFGDRWPRRRTMIGADVVRFVAQSLLALTLLENRASLASIAALTALVGAGTAFFYPARGGLIAEIVPKAQLARANSALSGGNSIAAILGPAIAAVLVSRVGAPWALGLDGLSYAVSALCLLLVRSRRVASRPTSGGSVLGELSLGFRAFAERRWLVLIVAQFGLLNLVALAPFMVLAPVLFSHHPRGAEIWGYELTGVGIGGLMAASSIMRKQPKRPALALQVGALLLISPLALLAVGLPYAAILLGGAGYGAGAAIVNVLIGTLIQREIPAHLLARVFSVVQITAGILAPAGYALAGPASAWLGPRLTMGVGAGLAAGSVALVLCWIDVRRISTSDLAA